MGIEINFTGKCRGCRTPVLHIRQRETYVNGKLDKREYFAKCEHENTCRKVVEFFELAIREEEKNGKL